MPSQTFTNRSFWTAATASGFVVNSPVKNWVLHNDAETIFNRLEQHGRTWKVYVAEPERFAITGLIHYPRLKDRFETHFLPFSQFEADAAAGQLPDFSFIEPCLVLGHGDYHPAVSRVLGHGVVLPGVDPPSSVLGGEAYLARIYNTYKAMRSPDGSNLWNTALLIGWDEPGGTYDHVPPGPVPMPTPSAPLGEQGFAFDRSGYRVPAVLVSPWVADGQVFNEEHRHTSLIATLREQWALGEPLTARDAAARTFSHAFTLDSPRDPDTWPPADPLPVPQYIEDALIVGKSLSTLGKAAFEGIRGFADHHGIQITGLPEDVNVEIPPEQALQIIRDFLAIHFPRLAPSAPAIPET
ncbi:alkaline phosphatase family protein [Streptomyces sp. NBC_00076]|uniref:alkaline phosphatase family protein n=1 Tax=Streptomyces sp. NBC_00076 TaxID=2975642 RepID=UPI0032454203